MTTGIRTAGSALLPLVFLASLWLPLVDDYFHLDPVSAIKENRKHARMPGMPLTYVAIDAYPTGFESFYRDSCGFRNTLIYANSAVKYFALGVPANSEVLIGKNGWLFSNSDPVISSFRGTNLLDESELKARGDEKRRRAEWCSNQGILYLDVWVPEKCTVYPALMPDWVVPVTQIRNLERWETYMQRNADVPSLNLTRYLLKAKQDRRVFYIADNHWNSFGAFVGYSRIMKKLQTLGLKTRVLRLQQLREPKWNGGYNLAQMLALDKHFVKPEPYLRPKQRTAREIKEVMPNGQRRTAHSVFKWQNKNRALPKLVLVGDSFGNEIIDFLCESFSQSVYIRRLGWDEKLIAEAAPDVVIELHVARHLEDHPSAEF